MRRLFRYDEELGCMVEVEPEERAPGLTISVRPNIAYASPIDGGHITTWAKREYDLQASGCVDQREAKEMVQDARANRRGLTRGLTLSDIKPYFRGEL